MENMRFKILLYPNYSARAVAPPPIQAGAPGAAAARWCAAVRRVLRVWRWRRMQEVWTAWMRSKLAYARATAEAAKQAGEAGNDRCAAVPTDAICW